MQLIDTDLTLAERELAEAAMGSDKEVLWFSRPVAKLWTAESLLSMVGGLVSGVFLGYVASRVWEGGCQGDITGALIFTCFLSPFIAVTLWQLLTPWRLRRQMRRTAYILTARQAIVLQPGWFGKRKLTSYLVRPDMVKEREVAADGSGSLVFGYRTVQGKHGSRRISQGFLYVSSIQQLETVLEPLVEAREEEQLPVPERLEDAPVKTAKKSWLGMIFGGVFALIGIGLLVGAWMNAAETCRTVESGVTVQGEVESLVRKRGGGRRGGSSYYPVFRFTAQDGNVYSVRSKSGSNPPAWEKGEKVKLIYQPDNPQSAIPDTTWGKYGGTIVLGFIGTIFTVIGSFVACVSRK